MRQNRASQRNASSPAQPPRFRQWGTNLGCLAFAALAVIGWVRTPASTRAGDADPPADLDEIRQQLASAGYAQRLRLLHKMGTFGSFVGATDAILDTLHNAKTQRLRLAANALLNAAKSDDYNTSNAAIEALGRAGTARSKSALIELLQRAESANAAAYELAQLSDPEARAALISFASSDATLSARQAAVRALGQLDGPEVQRTLHQLIKTAPHSVAASAVEQLAQTKGNAATPALLEAFDSGAKDVRLAALQALVEVSKPGEHSALFARVVRSGNQPLSNVAISALAKGKSPESKKLLMQLVQSPNADHCSHVAVEALASHSGDDVTRLLLKLARKGNYDAAQILHQKRGDDAKRELLELLESPTTSYGGKQVVAWALGDGMDLQALLKTSKNADPDIASTALRSIARIGG